MMYTTVQLYSISAVKLICPFTFTYPRDFWPWLYWNYKCV